MTTIEIQVTGMSLYTGDKHGSRIRVLAHAEISIPQLQISIRGATLTWTAAHGFSACAPSARDKTGAQVVRWPRESEFARVAAEKMAAMYEAMGGEMPREKRIETAVRVDHVTGKPIRPDPFEAVVGVHRTLGLAS